MAVATDLVLSVLTKRACVPLEALQCCDHGHGRPRSGVSRRSGNRSNRSRHSNHSNHSRHQETYDLDDEHPDRYGHGRGQDDEEAAWRDEQRENDRYCQAIWAQVRLELLSLDELRECVLRHRLIEVEVGKEPGHQTVLLLRQPEVEEKEYDLDSLHSNTFEAGEGREEEEGEEGERYLREADKILQHRSRANLEMIIDRWSHEEEREVKRNQVLEERRTAKHLKEAPSVWVFGANHEGEKIPVQIPVLQYITTAAYHHSITTV